MILKIGRRSTHEVASLAEASAVYAAARDASREGASTFPDGRITDGFALRGAGAALFRVSYNGRVWNAAGIAVYSPCASVPCGSVP